MLCKKEGIPDKRYMLHISEDYTGVRTNRTVKDRIGGYVGIRNDTVKQYKKSENKWKKYLKSLKKQNKMLYIISKKSGSRHEINMIKNIKAKASKKYSDSSSDYSDSDYSLSIDIIWDTYMQSSGRKEMNRLDHVVTKNLNNYKYQSNESINSEPAFGTSNFNLSRATSDPLPVVTIPLWGGNK